VGALCRWRDDWDAGLTLLAGQFHWPPSELDELDLDALLFWIERAREWTQWQNFGSSPN
jgi:hypothetical protein